MSAFKNLAELQNACAFHGINVDWLDDVLVFDFPNRDEPYYARVSEPKPLSGVRQARTCFVVVGVPRSGTSCVAAVLHHLGVRMGPFDTTVNEANPHGFFEHMDLVGFHGQIVGRGVESWRTLDRKFLLADDVRELYRAIVAHSERAVGEHGLWGFKDLRFFQLAHEFAGVVDSRVKIVEVTRARDAVRRSMLAYPGFKEEKPGEVDVIMSKWNLLKRRAVRVLTGRFKCPRLVLAYEGIVADPEAAVRDLAAFAGVEPTEAAVEFVRPELNRQGASVA